MPDGTTKIKNLPANWGTDSHVTVYMDGFVYSISGYKHYAIGKDNEDCGFSNNFKYGPMSGDFYRIGMSIFYMMHCNWF